MLIEKIASLDAILQRKHAKMYASLNEGKQINSSITTPLSDWYEWQDGQSQETENLFFNHYRFIPSEEARQLNLHVTEYSLPLLTDDAGEGYWFNTMNRKVFYNASVFYDKEDLLFASFDSFVEFLTELAESPLQNIGDFIGMERVLLEKYCDEIPPF